jgi:hypothetical protein
MLRHIDSTAGTWERTAKEIPTLSCSLWYDNVCLLSSGVQAEEQRNRSQILQRPVLWVMEYQHI